MSLRASIISALAILAASVSLSAQTPDGQTDSVVVLMNAKSLQMFKDDIGVEFRKVIDARFLHNNTYVICDTAYWYVNMRYIDAYGHVQILQDRTVLSSDRLKYNIDDNLAEFRGQVVQLLDKDGNTLRTRHLDYNTKDSVAIFSNGASMKDADGQVIESLEGTYDSKEKTFDFERSVNMYTDSVYVKTSRLLYHTDYDFAEFFGEIDAWKGHNMISSETGTYDRANERFFFNGDVHIMSDTQEGWSDSLYYDRNFNDVEMYGHIQVTDTVKNVSALGSKLFYEDSLSRVTLERDASVIARTDQGGKVDTVYIGADRFVYWTIPMCDIPAGVTAAAAKRLEALRSDPVTTYRRKAAEEAAKAAEEAGQDDPNNPEAAAKRREQSAGKSQDEAASISEKASQADIDDYKIDLSEGETQSQPTQDSLEARGMLQPQDSLAVADTLAVRDSIVVADSLMLADSMVAEPEAAPVDSAALAQQLALEREQAVRDSLAARDTTAIGFMTALGSVRLFRSDMQSRCDSLEYCDLDSLARMFISPIVWNEGNRQYTSDSLTLAIKDQRMDKASLMSNAFIIIQEDSICFDQIKGAEILAYFDSTTALTRFDALGGANAMFFLEENDAFATVNKVESKMLSATFVEGNLDRVYYFDSPKNDAYPVVQLPKEERTMKGFEWKPENRPTGPLDITPLELRPSERTSYLGRPMPKFVETDRYFPGHMKSIKKQLAAQDSLRRARHAEERRRQEEARALAEMMDEVADTLAAPLDSLVEEIAPEPEALEQSRDTTVVAAIEPSVADTLAVRAPADTVAPAAPHIPTEEELRKAALEQKAAEREAAKAAAEAKRQAKVDAREARWAELDARDAAKQAAKDAKALKKKRQRTYAAVKAAEKEAAKDQKKLERYIQKFEKKKLRKHGRKEELLPAGERPS